MVFDDRQSETNESCAAGSYCSFLMASQDEGAGVYHARMQNSWAQIAESTLPLKSSKMAAARGADGNAGPNNNRNHFDHLLLQSSVECRSRELSRKLVVVNSISLLVNLLLAIVAFYFAFVNDSSSTTAFAADCVLDMISSAIVLWRYYGDLDSVYMHAREQIACIYLGSLFEISAFAIIIKAASDIYSTSEISIESGAAKYDLIYLAAAGTICCAIMALFKYGLFKTIRDSSILLDAINTVISAVFALSIILTQVLINVNPSFWYLDPILSILLALFMIGFGAKVIHQNFNILRPIYYLPSQVHQLGGKSFGADQAKSLLNSKLPNKAASQYGGNLAYPAGNGAKDDGDELEKNRSGSKNKRSGYGTTNLSSNSFQNWQQADHSIIQFV